MPPATYIPAMEIPMAAVLSMPLPSEPGADRLAEAAAHAERGDGRVMLTRGGKAVAAVVPIEDVEALEAWEDERDSRGRGSARPLGSRGPPLGRDARGATRPLPHHARRRVTWTIRYEREPSAPLIHSTRWPGAASSLRSDGSRQTRVVPQTSKRSAEATTIDCGRATAGDLHPARRRARCAGAPRGASAGGLSVTHAPRAEPRRKPGIAPWLLALAGMAAGAAIFSAGMLAGHLIR